MHFPVFFLVFLSVDEFYNRPVISIGDSFGKEGAQFWPVQAGDGIGVLLNGQSIVRAPSQIEIADSRRIDQAKSPVF